MTKRSYKQNCALAQASDVIGERWSLLLVRDLLLGTRRFGELQQSLRGMGSNLLSSRLRELETVGIVKRKEDEENRPSYELTDAGKALEPTLLSLIRWGLAYGPQNQKTYHHQDNWDLLALKALFQANRAVELSFCVQFKTPDFAGWVVIESNNLSVGLGQADSADLIVDGTVKDLFFGSQGHELCSFGLKKDLKRFMSAFALPD